MSGSAPVYHHLIPQTYMKPWCFSGDTIWTYNKDSKLSEPRNISNICGKNYFHSIRAGSLYTNDEALNNIFGFLLPYTISYQNLLLETTELMNRNFANFSEWTILYPNGKRVNKRDRNIILQRIIQTNDNSIEERWNTKFENDWSTISLSLFDALKKIQKKEPIALTGEVASLLMEYFIMFEWRGKIGNATLNNVWEILWKDILDLPDIEIPEKERIYPYDKSAIEEMKHAFLLRSFDTFLSGDGTMYESYKIYNEQLTYVFLISETEEFITSDNPCFTFTNKDGLKEPVFVALPNLLISLAKKDINEPHAYKIAAITSKEVNEYNKTIFDNGSMILSRKQLF